MLVGRRAFVAVGAGGGVCVGTGVGVTVGGTGVAVAVGEGEGVGVQLGVKVNVGRGVRVGRGVSVGTRTNSVPTEQPKLANKAVTSSRPGNNLCCVIYFFTNQTKSQYL